MKIRTGFVSNSSSSSFIVAFNPVPDSAHALQMLLFGDAKDVTACGYTESTQALATAIWEELQRGAPITAEEAATHLRGLAMAALRGKVPFPSQDDEEEREQWYAAHEKVRQETAAAFFADNPDASVYYFSFGDNVGDVIGRLGIVLEEGNVFARVPHLVSNTR